MTARTLSEIRATCTKAARGAGCPWGLAEEAGVAAARLQAQGLPGAETLAALFETPRNCACSNSSGTALCGLKEMARFSDLPPSEEQKINASLAAPLLFLAPMLDMSRDGSSWQMEWPDGQVSCDGNGLNWNGDQLPLVVNSLRIKRTGPTKDSNTPSPASQPVDPNAWDKLLASAAKTYVPETDQSRSAGAGPDASNDD